MKKFFVKTLAVLLICLFVISGFNFSIFASSAVSSGNLGDKLVAMNVALSGRVKMQFYFTNVLENVDHYVVNIDGVEQTTYVKNMATSEKNGDTRYLLEVSVAAAQQTLPVTITPYAADGTEGKVRTYSVRDYVDKVIALDKESGGDTYHSVTEALKSMLNYGAMAQTHFGYKTESLANNGLYFGSTNPVNNMSTDNVYGIENPVYNTNGDVLGFSAYEAYLYDTVAIRCYLDYTGDISNLNVEIEGEDCGNHILMDDKGRYYVTVDNIPATQFDHQYNIVVTDGDNIVTLKYSVLNYILSKVKNSDPVADETVIDTVYSMFTYYVKMSEYAGEEIADKPVTCKHKRSYVEDGTYAEICSDCGKDITPTTLVGNANELANGVTSYFGKNDNAGSGTVDALRENYVVENRDTNVYYPLASDQLATITNNEGEIYVQNTMDVYVKTTNGEYLASKSTKSATANIYRYGYYYYDIHAYGQNFIEDNDEIGNITATQAVSLNSFASSEFSWETFGTVTAYNGVDISYETSDAENTLNNGSALKFKISSTSDPQIYMTGTEKLTNTGTHNAIRITMKTPSTTQVQLRYTTTSSESFGETHRVDFNTIADSSAYNTYLVYFDETTDIYKLRLDFEGGAAGEAIEITSIEFVTVNMGDAPQLLLDRGLHTYTDKMHQVLSIVAPKGDVAVTEVGMTTNVTASDVVIVTTGNVWYGKNSAGNADGTAYEHRKALSDSISGVAYAGFLTAAGVFGYILPYGDETSTITVSCEGTNSYKITQTIENVTIEQQPTIYSSADLETYKASDSTIGTSMNIYNSPAQFYFGQRIYTDTTDASDNFATFLEEAYIERNPLTKSNIQINTDKTPDATFDGYDGYRGMYAFTIPENIGFNAGYYYAQNFHGEVSFSITGDEHDRNMYVMAYSYGCSVEGGAVLDRDDTLLPIPAEVSKNFNHEFEEPIWLWGDVGYSEVRIPVYVNAGETEELSILQTYMNWGQYPLKQISSIQFFAPYYHLSTGTTESNCIANYYVSGKDLQTLPDHRAASAPWWSDHETETGDPQHDNGGYHLWLQYTDGSGNKYSSEPVSSVINSAGLTYADIDMTYRSDDNKIKVTYTHMEMPQTDENRAYYEMRYTALENVTINFAESSFYSVYGYGNGYETFSYWNGSESVVVENLGTSTSYGPYTLGGSSSYFTLYNIDNVDSKGNQRIQNANVSFLIDIENCKLPTSLSGSNFIVNVDNRCAALSLDAGTVTLEKDDEIVIYAVVMPWGYYDAENDTLVQNVLANTLTNPIVATAGANAEVVDSKFLPTAATTNKRDAIITIGHQDSANAPVTRDDMGVNVTFRVDGFKVLATPVLEETTDGGLTWTTVDISSINNPDRTGSAHNYDGYAVYYNKDAETGEITYSYSFVTNIKGSSRTFRVTVDDTYVGWEEGHGDLHYGADSIYKFASKGVSLGEVTQTIEDGVDFVRLTNGGTNDPATSSFQIVGGSAAKYMVVKYRIPEGNKASGLQFFMTTYGTYDGGLAVEKGGDGINDTFILQNSVVVQDGTWQVMVVDLAALVAEAGIGGNMIASSAGTYSLSSFRFDPFTVASTDYIDVAYIAFCRDINNVVQMNSDMSTDDISYVTGASKSMPIQDLLDELEAKKNYADMNVVFTGNALANMMLDGVGDKDIAGAVVNSDGTVTVTSGTTGDSYFYFSVNGTATGKYLVMKYKIDKDTTVKYSKYQSYAYDANDTYTGHKDLYGVHADGKWHTVVVDLTMLGSGITTSDDGKYYVTQFRADILDALAAGSSIDFEYIGLCDELSDIKLSGSERLEFTGMWTGYLGSVTIDGADATKNSISYESGATQTTALNGIEWATSGSWIVLNGNALTDISICVTDKLGVEHVTPLGSGEWGERTGDITTHAKTATASGGLGYNDNTVGYRFETSADLSDYDGQTVTLSLRATTSDGITLTFYSVEITVPEIEDQVYDNLDIVAVGENLYTQISTQGKTENYSAVLNNDGTVTLTKSAALSAEAYFTIMANKSGATKVETGKYLVMKYRTTAANLVNGTIFAGSTNYGAVEGENFSGVPFHNDGEWHVVAIDLTQSSAVVEEDGVYKVNYVRIDLAYHLAAGETIDFGYIGFCDDLADIDASDTIFGAPEFAAQYQLNVDDLGEEGGTTAGLTSGNNSIDISRNAGTTDKLSFVGWLALDKYAYTNVAYVVVADGVASEMTVIADSVVFEQGVYDAGVDAYGDDTHAYRIRFGTTSAAASAIDLSAYAGKTVKVYLAAANVVDMKLNSIALFHEVTVTVPAAGEEVEKPYENLDVYFAGQDLVNMMTDNSGNHGDKGISSAVLNADGTVTVKYDNSGDRYFSFELDGSAATGQYLVIKYRTGLGVNVADNGTVNYLGSTSADKSWTGHLKLTTIVADHKWHTLVIDLADLASVTENNGSYYVTLVRADFFDALSASGSVDFAYVGLCDTGSDIKLEADEYLELSWQNWSASLDSITIDGAPVDHDSAANKHLEASAGASDRKYTYEGAKWAWSGWFSVDGQDITDISVCVTDENGVEYWTSFGTPAGRADLNTEGSMYAEKTLGYTSGTLCYAANVSADLSAYADQTVTVSVRAITSGGQAVTLYSVFVTVPKSAAPHWISGAELEGYLRDGIHTGNLNDDGSLTITAAQDDNAGSQFTNSFHGEFTGMTAPKYAVLRYKTTTETSIGIYARTSSSTGYKYIGTTIKNDGMWHTIIIDLATEQYVVGEAITYFRIDTCWVNGNSITIDYIYLCSEEELPEFHRADFINGDELSRFVRTDCYDYSLNDDGTLTITGKTAGDNYFNGFQSLMSGLPATKYAVVRYKTTTETSLTILASTGTNEAGPYTASSLINDGFWHIAVLDLTACSGYVVGDTFSFMRINTCKTEGSSITFDYIMLCDDLTGLTVSPPKYKTNVDYLLVDDATNVGTDNLRSSKAITGTKVHFTGWSGISGAAATGVYYVVVDAQGNETVVESAPSYQFTLADGTATGTGCTWNLSRSDLDSQFTSYDSGTVGFGGSASVDLSDWAGQTVAFTIRVTTNAGYDAEIFSVAVTVPAA